MRYAVLCNNNSKQQQEFVFRRIYNQIFVSLTSSVERSNHKKICAAAVYCCSYNTDRHLLLYSRTGSSVCCPLRVCLCLQDYVLLYVCMVCTAQRMTQPSYSNRRHAVPSKREKRRVIIKNENKMKKDIVQILLHMPERSLSKINTRIHSSSRPRYSSSRGSMGDAGQTG